MPRGLLERATDLIALSVDPLDGDSIDWSRGPDPEFYNSDYNNNFDTSNSSLSSALFEFDSLGDYTDGQFVQPSSGNGAHRTEPMDTNPLSFDSTVWQQPADALSDEQWVAMCSDTPGIQLGGRLSQFADAYEQAGAWTFLVDWLRNGIMLPFYNAVPPPRIRLENHSSSNVHQEWVTQQIVALLQSGAIIPFDDPHCVSPLGVAIRERDGKKRLVLDNRFINMFIVCVSFRMEKLDLLSRIIASGEYMFSADLRSGYHHVPVHEDFWTFLGFTWEGVSYVFKVLPFGLSLSPFVFSKITRWVMKHFRTSYDLPGSVYIDDFLFSVGLDYERALKVIPPIVKTFRHFGWIVAADKSHRIPATRIQHLGMIVDSVARCFQAPESRLISVEKKLGALLKSADNATFRLIAQALGSLVALTPAVGPVNIYSVDIMAVFNSTKKNNRSSWDQRVSLSADAIEDVKFWLDRIRRANGKAIWPPDKAVTILSDAGDQGYGATLRRGGTVLDRDVTGTWKRSEVTKSSTWREMKAVIYALRHFEKDVRGKSVLIITDNSANASCLTKKNCKALGLIPLLREIWALSLDFGCVMKAEWTSRVNLRHQDQLGRLHPNSEDWTISNFVFQLLDRMWGPHTVDRFAMPFNAKTDRFNCPVRNIESEGCDAFSCDWSGENNWINPGLNLSWNAFDHLRSCRAVGTIIVPTWTSAYWWKRLSDEAVDRHYLPPLSVCIRNYGPDTNLPRIMGSPCPKWSLVAFRFDFRNT